MKIIKETQKVKINQVFDSLMQGSLKEAHEGAAEYAKVFGKFPGLSDEQRSAVIVEAWKKDREDIFCEFISKKYPLRFVYQGQNGPFNLLKQIVHVLSVYESPGGANEPKCRMLKHLIQTAGSQNLFIDEHAMDYTPKLIDLPMELGQNSVMTLLEYAFKNKADNLAFDLLAAGANPFISLNSMAIGACSKMYGKSNLQDSYVFSGWLKEISVKLRGCEKRTIEQVKARSSQDGNGFFRNLSDILMDAYSSLLYKPVIVGAKKSANIEVKLVNAICTKSVEVSSVENSVFDNLPNVPIAQAAFRGESFLRKVVESTETNVKRGLSLIIREFLDEEKSANPIVKNVGWINPGSPLFWDYMALFSVQRSLDVVSKFKLSDGGAIGVSENYCKRTFLNFKSTLIRWTFESTDNKSPVSEGSTSNKEEINESVQREYLNGLWKKLFKYNKEPFYVAYPYLASFGCSLIRSKDKDVDLFFSSKSTNIFIKYLNRFKIEKCIAPFLELNYGTLIEFWLKKSTEQGVLTYDPGALRVEEGGSSVDMSNSVGHSTSISRNYYKESLVVKRENFDEFSTKIIEVGVPSAPSKKDESQSNLIGLEQWLNQYLSEANIEGFLNLNKKNPGKMVFLLMQLFVGVHLKSGDVYEKAKKTFGSELVSNFVDEINAKIVKHIYDMSLKIMIKKGETVFDLIFDNVNLNIKENHLFNLKASAKGSLPSNDGLISEYSNDASFFELMCAKKVYENNSYTIEIIKDILDKIEGAMQGGQLNEVGKLVNEDEVAKRANKENSSGQKAQVNCALNDDLKSYLRKRQRIDVLLDIMDGEVWNNKTVSIQKVIHPLFWNMQLNREVLDLMFKHAPSMMLSEEAKRYFALDPVIWVSKLNAQKTGGMSVVAEHLERSNVYLEKIVEFINSNCQSRGDYDYDSYNNLGNGNGNSVNFNLGCTKYSTKSGNSLALLQFPTLWTDLIKKFCEPGVLPDFGNVKELSQKVSAQLEWLYLSNNLVGASRFVEESEPCKDDKDVVVKSKKTKAL